MIYIHVNKHTIAKNGKHGTNEPPLAVRRTKTGKAIYGHSVRVHGPSQYVYSAREAILKCGAKLVTLTNAKVTITNEVTGETVTIDETGERLANVYEMTGRERDTVLAALRYWQRHAVGDPMADEASIADNGGTVTPLDEFEIDTLCENLSV